MVTIDLPWSARRFQADVLVSLRRHAGVSQARLARRLGVEQPEVSRWEQGHALLTPYWIARIGHVLALDAENIASLTTGVGLLEYERFLAREPDTRRLPVFAGVAIRR